MENVANLEQYVRESQIVLIFLTLDYITSENCQREYVAALAKYRKPIVLLVETEVTHGAYASYDELEAVIQNEMSFHYDADRSRVPGNTELPSLPGEDGVHPFTLAERDEALRMLLKMAEPLLRAADSSRMSRAEAKAKAGAEARTRAHLARASKPTLFIQANALTQSSRQSALAQLTWYRDRPLRHETLRQIAFMILRYSNDPLLDENVIEADPDSYRDFSRTSTREHAASRSSTRERSRDRCCSEESTLSERIQDKVTDRKVVADATTAVAASAAPAPAALGSGSEASAAAATSSTAVLECARTRAVRTRRKTGLKASHAFDEQLPAFERDDNEPRLAYRYEIDGLARKGKERLRVFVPSDALGAYAQQVLVAISDAQDYGHTVEAVDLATALSDVDVPLVLVLHDAFFEYLFRDRVVLPEPVRLPAPVAAFASLSAATAAPSPSSPPSASTDGASGSAKPPTPSFLFRESSACFSSLSAKEVPPKRLSTRRRKSSASTVAKEEHHFRRSSTEVTDAQRAALHAKRKSVSHERLSVTHESHQSPPAPPSPPPPPLLLRQPSRLPEALLAKITPDDERISDGLERIRRSGDTERHLILKTLVDHFNPDASATRRRIVPLYSTQCEFSDYITAFNRRDAKAAKAAEVLGPVAASGFFKSITFAKFPHSSTNSNLRRAALLNALPPPRKSSSSDRRSKSFPQKDGRVKAAVVASPIAHAASWSGDDVVKVATPAAEGPVASEGSTASSDTFTPRRLPPSPRLAQEEPPARATAAQPDLHA